MQDIKDNKIIIKPASSLTPVVVQTSIRQLDNLAFKLIPIDNANPLASVDVGKTLKEKKWKKLN